MTDQLRADPDALLATMKEEGRGKLTVFLGAAAGVGKTYAMLEGARENIAEGWDIAIGWIETHGRKETQALVEGLEIIPPRYIEYRGKKFAEMDLQAILKRRPEVVLVDELAHTNIPGSVNTRRYQDVEEILEAGIDVYTTLNIQHIESLNDIVGKITGVSVKETVPDTILEDAQIQLVDIPPEDLIERLKEGKVYVPEQAHEAMRKFFRPGNISALRELALRYTAQQVDRYLETYMRAHAIEGPWPAGEKVMVCITPGSFAGRILRIGRRMANGLKAELFAVYVDTPQSSTSNREGMTNLTKNFHLAEELGAQVIILSGNDVVKELLGFARKHNVTQIIIGKPIRSKINEWFKRSVVNKIIAESEGIGVHVISQRKEKENEKNRYDVKDYGKKSFTFLPYAGVILFELLVTVLLLGIASSLGTVNIALIYVLPVIFSAFKWGRGPSIFSSVLSVIAFDFLFIPPFFTFGVPDLKYLVSFAILLFIGIMFSMITERSRRQMEFIRKREVRISSLYGLSREIAAISELDQLARTVTRKISESFEGNVAIMLPDEAGRLNVKANTATPKDDFINENELAVATWVFEHKQMAGYGTDTLNGSKGVYLPIRTEEETHGVLGIKPNNRERYLQPEQRKLLEAFANLTAIALTRIKLAKKAEEARLLSESERLHTALLNSLSHDLHTPLASIIGAVTGLLEEEEVFSPTDRRELLQAINQGAQRMNRLVNNLLEMTKLEGGILKLKKEWCDIEDIIGVSVKNLSMSAGNRQVKISVEPGLPLLQVDFVLIEQVMINLIDNALKYSELGTEVTITAHRSGNNIQVNVADQGPTIPEEDLEYLFEKFYRLKSVRQISGTGFVLTICKGIIEAHGGKIWAKNNLDKGVTITFILPITKEEPDKIPVINGGDGSGH